MTNNYYIASPHGEIYGLDHTAERFDPFYENNADHAASVAADDDHKDDKIMMMIIMMIRFDPWMVAKLRPQTDIPGLYLTGQDVLSCGFTGALFSGVLSAQVGTTRIFGDKFWKIFYKK